MPPLNVPLPCAAAGTFLDEPEARTRDPRSGVTVAMLETLGRTNPASGAPHDALEVPCGMGNVFGDIGPYRLVRPCGFDTKIQPPE